MGGSPWSSPNRLRFIAESGISMESILCLRRMNTPYPPRTARVAPTLRRSSAESVVFIITCEHGGNRIPPAYRALFHGAREVLDSHRGYDPGALVTARRLAKTFDAPLIASTVSRLLVELNRSPGHARMFSEFTRDVPDDIREQIVRRHYTPYREQVEQTVRSLVQRHRVIHISSHSFTPVLDGEVRNADVGLLYDPRRPGESALCRQWQQALGELAPEFRVRRNYPYTGKSDGLTSLLRKRHPDELYVGIELELNQRIVGAGGLRAATLRKAVTAALQIACAELGVAANTIGRRHDSDAKAIRQRYDSDTKSS